MNVIIVKIMLITNMKGTGNMIIEDYYTKDEIDYICMYYGQIPENLTYNMKVMLVEKLENEIVNKVEKIKRERS
jgi:hypothetical protein